MKKQLKKIAVLLLLLGTNFIIAQVGIGTTTPNASAILDMTSISQGVLTPRLTSIQRNGIVAPADGLLVYDTDIKSFYHYNFATSTWIKINSDVSGRLKYKLIKSTDVLATVLATELAAGGGTSYKLDSTTLYEINGVINLNFPIDLNNAYIIGLDSSDDRIERATGDLFVGATGGSIRVLTLIASTGKVFSIDGPATQSLILRDCIIRSSANVGSIKGFNFVFLSIVLFTANTNGIIYENINKLLLSNAGWFSSNTGTYEKLVGNFGLVTKQGGFSEVINAAVGFDVSSNPTITGDAIMESVVFTGTLTTGKYVNSYFPATFPGFNFNTKWNVRSAGIPTEADAVAIGDINFDYTLTTGVITTLSGTPIKLLGTTTSNELFRFSRGGVDNRLVYLGSKKRFFSLGAAISFQTTADNTTFVFYIAKNNAIISKSKVYVRSNSTTDVLAIPIRTVVEMTTNDFIEIYVGRETGTGDVKITTVNLTAN